MIDYKKTINYLRWKLLAKTQTKETQNLEIIKNPGKRNAKPRNLAIPYVQRGRVRVQLECECE